MNTTQLLSPISRYVKMTNVQFQMNALGIHQTLDLELFEKILDCGFDSRTLLASSVLSQILAENRPITVRGAFYRAVSAGIYPNTSGKHYRQASNIILELRRGGAVPYSWIADSTRIRTKPSSWGGLDEYQESLVHWYRKDLWAQQNTYVEVAVEKDAMAGVLRPVTSELDVFLNVIRGNASETFVYTWAESLKHVRKPIVIYYLGDHDPNGLDIERDLRRRLEGFLNRPIEWHRLAITAEDFQRQDLLGFPTRETSHKGWKSRLDEYVQKYGDRCIEVDAIPPNEIRERLRSAIENHIDQTAWEQLKDLEAAEKETIKAIDWTKIGGAS